MMECAAAASPKPLCTGFRRTLNPVAQRHDRWSNLCSGVANKSGKPVPIPLFWAYLKIGQNHFKEHTRKLALLLMARQRNRAGMRKISFFQGPSHYLLRTLLKCDTHHSRILKKETPPVSPLEQAGAERAKARGRTRRERKSRERRTDKNNEGTHSYFS